jgi:hypothetical protein
MRCDASWAQGAPSRYSQSSLTPDDHAVAFYEGFGFKRFPTRSGRLFLLTSTAAEAFARAADSRVLSSAFC